MTGAASLPAGEAGEPCVFCEIVAGHHDASIVYDDDTVLAFMDLRQVGEGHCLVIPKQHIRDIYTLDDATGAALLALTRRVAIAAKAAFGANGILIWQSNDPPLQEVLHVHFHVMPRNPGDGLMRIYPGLPEHAGRGELDRQAALIQQALQSVS